MATPEHTNLPPTGPFVGIAVFCEKVIQEAGGTYSLIRVTDTLNQAAVGPDVPRDMPPFIAALTLVIMLKAGQATGSADLTIRPEAPGGFKLPALEQRVSMQQGGPWGPVLFIPMQLPISVTGVYWFDVLLGDPTTNAAELLTRVPLEVLYSRGSAS
jgi:hypothetical protein